MQSMPKTPASRRLAAFVSFLVMFFPLLSSGSPPVFLNRIFPPAAADSAPLAATPTPTATNTGSPLSATPTPASTSPAAAATPGADLCDRGCIPLIDMQPGQTYFGELGGLYGDYSNDPPAAHVARLNAAAVQITPLDAEGNPSPAGKIVVLSSGMSNTRREFEAFIGQASDDSAVSSDIVLVNGARGPYIALNWAYNKNDIWGDYVNQKLAEKAVNANQVQVVWLLQANYGPADSGLPTCKSCLATTGRYVSRLAEHNRLIVQQIHNRYPNVKLVFFSSRNYGGYAKKDLNDEPYAYENAIAVRRVILDQINGSDERIAYTGAPVLAWGPYFWSDGKNANREGLAWFPDDFIADGTHPVEFKPGKGAEKAAGILLQFFKTSPYTSTWFTAVSVTPAPTPKPATHRKYLIW
jgi:hypothetical protein